MMGFCQCKEPWDVLNEVCGACLLPIGPLEPTPMTESEADEFYRSTVNPKVSDVIFECLEREYVNYCRSHPSKQIEFAIWQDAAQLGYAEGLKAGRAEAVKLHADVMKLASKECPTYMAHPQSVWWIIHVKQPLMKLLAAFDKGGADEA